jgi:hypothetical protein
MLMKDVKKSSEFAIINPGIADKAECQMILEKCHVERLGTIMSHGVQRQKESPEKEVARREKEQAQLEGYLKLTEDVMTRVLPTP